MENTFTLYDGNDEVTVSLDRLLSKMEEGGLFLELSVKGVRPCLENLLAAAADMESNSQIVVGDMVARLTSAEKQLNEALYLVQDALSTVSTGFKFYKSTASLQEVV
ncbi:MAG: hypothetical protein IJ916_08375 [Paludibacteraceae bacterium]|nr:hypothetical protein [Paludibacteraceae bacterium]MBR2261703.1 hypothetical protein [Paludibacteraceae bacterium]MEE3483444.1 hypothetical protein [Bacteroidales bacterium]